MSGADANADADADVTEDMGDWTRLDAGCRSVQPHLRIKSSNTTLPAIDPQVHAREIAARETTQQHQHARQLLRPPHPAHRIPVHPDLPRVREPGPLIQHRIHIPRRDAIDSDTMHSPLRGEGGLQRQQGRLGGVVRGLRLGIVDFVRGHGGDQDDRAGVFVRDHGPRSGLGAEEGAGGVDVEGAAEFVGGHGEGVRAADDAGEAAEDVEAAERGCDAGHGVVDGLRVGHVEVCGRDARGGEVCAEGVDVVFGGGGKGEVEEREAGEAVFEECAGVGEG